jgi:general secretion pathway protein K
MTMRALGEVFARIETASPTSRCGARRRDRQAAAAYSWRSHSPNQQGTHRTDSPRQRGAAIITALLVVSLAAILVAGILWRQQVQVRRIENQRLLAQAQWVARGALDWTRLILRAEADTSPTVTYLGGVWAVPIAKTRLSDFLGKIGEAQAGEGAQTYVSGAIEDAQGRFNLRNLVLIPAPGILQLNMVQIMAFQRLLQLLGLNGQLAKPVALQVRAGLLQSATRFQIPPNSFGGTPPPQVGGAIGGTGSTDKAGLEGDNDQSNAAALQMTNVDSLLNVPGFTPEIVARLRPFVTVLPTQTAVNMNTASAEVIAAIEPGMSLSSAQAFVERRQTVFFRNSGEVDLALRGAGAPPETNATSGQTPPEASSGQIPTDVTTSYFFIHGRVQHLRAEVDRTTLVYRDPLTHSTRIVSVSDQL